MDEAIVAAQLNSTDSDMLQADHTILTESDMRFTPEQWKAIQELRSGKGLKKRNAMRNLQLRWTNGVVPYSLSGGFSARYMQAIRSGINEWNKFSCVNIRPATRNDQFYINVTPTGGCSSAVGMIRRRGQTMTLGRGCGYKGTVAHEFGHALGFHHEQTRPDRDNYIRILSQNINSNMLYNFKKYNWNMINAYDVPYDYESIMHYGKTAFSINGQITMQTVRSQYQDIIGQSFGVSFSDIKLINLMYSCNKKCPKQRCSGSGFVGKDCKCWCKGPNIRQPAIYCDSKRPVSGGNTVGPRPTRPPTTGGGGGGGSCQDTDRNCRYWASKGFCNTPEFQQTMRTKCRASCRFC